MEEQEEETQEEKHCNYPGEQVQPGTTGDQQYPRSPWILNVIEDDRSRRRSRSSRRPPPVPGPQSVHRNVQVVPKLQVVHPGPGRHQVQCAKHHISSLSREWSGLQLCF